MDADARTRMVEGTVQLLATVGLQGASIGAVLAVSGAPRGSVYHYFPDGKDQLVAEALASACERTLRRIAVPPGSPPAEVVTAFLAPWRELLLRSGFRAGCSAAAVAVAAEGAALREAGAAVFDSWRASLVESLGAAGLEAGEAAAFATLVIASTEGAVILSRAAQGIEPFDTVATHLIELAHRVPGGPGGAPAPRAAPARRGGTA
jgi:AcrR family transcriptional regulator